LIDLGYDDDVDVVAEIELDVELTAAPGVALVGRRTAALGYNGTSPGPMLRLAPGDLLRIRLINHLDVPTNLHLHGVHVSPQDHGDNPFLSIAAGSVFDYAYRIPPDHPTGTYWYHPHHPARSRISSLADSPGRWSTGNTYPRSPRYPGRRSGGGSSTPAPHECSPCAWSNTR